MKWQVIEQLFGNNMIMSEGEDDAHNADDKLHGLDFTQDF